MYSHGLSALEADAAVANDDTCSVTVDATTLKVEDGLDASLGITVHLLDASGKSFDAGDLGSLYDFTSGAVNQEHGSPDVIAIGDGWEHGFMFDGIGLAASNLSRNEFARTLY